MYIVLYTMYMQVLTCYLYIAIAYNIYPALLTIILPQCVGGSKLKTGCI